MIGKTSVLLMVALSACASDASEPSSDTAVLQLKECRGERKDAFTLGALTVTGDELHIQVQTGGGCERHTFSVCWDGAVLDSYPPQANLALIHDGHGDSCDALLTRDVRVDLAPMRTRLGPPIVLHVTGASSQLAGTTNSATFE